jgi:hypothetical protein
LALAANYDRAARTQAAARPGAVFRNRAGAVSVVQEDSFQFTATQEVLLDVSTADVDVDGSLAAGGGADSEASGSLGTEAISEEQASNDNTAEATAVTATAGEDPLLVALG